MCSAPPQARPAKGFIQQATYFPQCVAIVPPSVAADAPYISKNAVFITFNFSCFNIPEASINRRFNFAGDGCIGIKGTESIFPAAYNRILLNFLKCNFYR